MTKLYYEKSGDNYLIKDPFKLLALKEARKTAKNLQRFSNLGINISEITPSIIYSRLLEELVHQTEAHYAVNITGHGWRKIMRANKLYTYFIEIVPQPQPIFDLIKKYSKSSDYDMYDSYNMGAGFALFAPQKSVEKILLIAKKFRTKAFDAGVVKKGTKQVLIKPLGIKFSNQSLQIR